MIEELLPIAEITNFKFGRKPISIPPDLRPLWKISQIVLVLKLCSREEKASIIKLQFFNWVLASDEAMEQIKQSVLLNDNINEVGIIHLDPSVNRAVEFAIGERLFDLNEKGSIYLTNKGEKLAQYLIEDKELFVKEKSSLSLIGKSISETKVKKLLKN